MEAEKKPTPGEVGVISGLIQTWPEVLQAELRRVFREDAPDRRDEAVSMLREYLLACSKNFLDRYLPDRNRAAPALALAADLGTVLIEPRGAFRMWVRSMSRWVYRDWCRRRRQTGEAFEVHVVPDGAKDEIGVSFDRLEADNAEEDQTDAADERDAARDIVTELMCAAPADLQRDIAVFLAAAEHGDARAVLRAQGTNMTALVQRLSRLRPHAAQARRTVDAWAS